MSRMLVHHFCFTLAFFTLTDPADLSENSEAFVCSMEETSGRGNGNVIFNTCLKSCMLLFLDFFRSRICTVCIYFSWQL